MSIIDTLIVELKIDTTNFEQGEKKVGSSLTTIRNEMGKAKEASHKTGLALISDQDKLGDSSKKTARGMTDSGAEASGFFSKIRNEAIMMLGVFTAGAGLVSFTKNTVAATASTGILATQIGVNISKLAAMEAAAQRAGAAQGAMSDQLADEAKKSSDVKAGASVSDVYGEKFLQYGGDYRNMGDADSQLEEYAKIYESIKRSGIERGGMTEKQATAYASQQITDVGLNAELIPLISQGTDAMNAQIAAQLKKVSVTEKDAKAAREAEVAWFDFSQQVDEISKRVVLSLIPSLKKLTKWVEKIEFPDSKELSKTIDKWVEKIDDLFTVLDKIISKINDFAQSVGGWEVVLKSLIALKLASWTLGLISMTAAITGFGGAASLAGIGVASLLKPLALLMAAGAGGFAIGSVIEDALPDKAKKLLSNTVGKGVARVGAFFGHEESKEALRVNSGKKSVAGKKVSSKKGSVASIIQSGESGKREYNAYNRGSGRIDTRGGTPAQNLTNLTIGQIQARQARKHGDKQRLFAVGKYQIVKDTLKEAVASMKLSKNEKFTPELQDRMFSEFLAGSRRRDMKKYITGKSNNKNKAIFSASKEWASIANPRTGKSYYAGKGGNKAHISAKKMGDGLDDARAKYNQNIKLGLSEKKAYNLALQGAVGKTAKETKSKPVEVKVIDKKAAVGVKPKKTYKPFKIKTVRDKETGKLKTIRVRNEIKTKTIKETSTTIKDKLKTIINDKTKTVLKEAPVRLPKAILASKGGHTMNNQKTNININVKSTDPKQAATEIKTTLGETMTGNFASGML